jgi:hypothetical protein
VKKLLSIIAIIVGVITRFAVFLLIAVVGGFGSAWVMVHSGSKFSTIANGSWVTWPQSGRPEADPYTRAHTVRLGLLPLNSTMSLTYHARNDAEGGRIHSSCEYQIEADTLDAAWWSLAVFDDRGGLIPNTAGRHAFNTATIVRESDGGATIVLARDARPGNWLPTGGAGNLTLSLSIQDARWSQQTLEDQSRTKPLPAIRKVSCR